MTDAIGRIAAVTKMRITTMTEPASSDPQAPEPREGHDPDPPSGVEFLFCHLLPGVMMAVGVLLLLLSWDR